MPPRLINENVHGKRTIRSDISLRPGRYFKIFPKFLLNLQVYYDLEIEPDKPGSKLDSEEKICFLVE